MIPIRIRRRPTRGMLALLGTAAATLAGCGSSGGPGEVGTDTDDRIIATTGIWADVTSNVLCGDAVAAVMPPGADPHAFEPSLRDRGSIEAASVVIANGNGLEESLLDLLDTAAAGGVTVVAAADHVEPLEPLEPAADTHDSSDGDGDQDGDHERDHDHDHDPHVWLDPRRVSEASGAIADAAGPVSGHDPDEIARCAADYRAQLAELDRSITDRLAAIPAEQRILVTNHDSFGYFADRYGFDVVGTVIPSVSTLGEASAGQLADLADVIEAHDVRAIFVEQLESAADAEALADRLGIAVVELDTGALTDTGPSSTYVGMMSATADAIAEALG